MKARTSSGLVRLPRAAARLRGYILRPLRMGRARLVLSLHAFCRASGLCHRTAQKALAELRRADPLFHWEKLRFGRSFRVVVSLRPPSIREVSSNEETKKITKNRARTFPTSGNASRGASPRSSLFFHGKGIDPKRRGRFAAFLARTLAAEHWESCRVKFNLGHALNFARRAILDGFAAVAVTQAYRRGLERRHADALDAGQANWEPSSTVSFASALLAKWRANEARA